MIITDLRRLPARPNLEQYKKQAKDLVKAHHAGDDDGTCRAARFLGTAPQRLTLTDAQFVIAREHGFASWPKFTAHVKALQYENSSVTAFETAVDAIAHGDEALLQQLLLERPQLVFERSARSHAATLLNYTAANGVEDYRQKTLPNIAKMVDRLLRAGAEVDAIAHIYGGSTTLSLTASSVHPERAGVQIDLLRLLLDNGAAIDGAAACANPILAALRNGRGRAAVFLAERRARLNLESAAGTGQIDAVRNIIERGEYDPMERASGVAWACAYGHINMVEYLLDNGSDPNGLAFGQTPLHWAVMGAHPKVVRLLLERNASPQIRNKYGGTALGQAYWSAERDDDPKRFEPVFALLASAETGS